MAVSLFSLKKNPTSKLSSLVDPTKFGAVFSATKSPPLKSEISKKAIETKEIKELSYIRRSLETLVSLEKRHYELLTDSIKDFVLSEEKRQAKEEENLQEKPQNKVKSNDGIQKPVIKQGAKLLDGIGNFFKGLIKTFIAYKILQWVGNPENTKKIQDFVNLFGNIFKFLNAIIGFGVDRLLSGFSKLINGDGVSKVFGFLEAVTGFFTLKWLLNPTKIISDIKMIGNLFTQVIPNAINGVINFFTNLIPTAVSAAADEALGQAGKQISGGASDAAKGAGIADDGANAATKGVTAAAKGVDAAKGMGAAAKGGAKVTGKSILKALPVIGAVSSAFFAADRISKGDWLGAGGEVLSGVAGLLPGWGTVASLGIDAALIGRDIAKDQGIPMLANGGIVTKPTEAIVGEAGPEAILPLDKLGSFGIDGFKAATNKVIPKFMTLLTLPFKIIGAGILALISSTVGKIPGIGQFIKPLISNIASGFGLPPGLVSGMTGFVGGVGEMVTSGMGDVAELFGKQEININQQKGEDFNASRDTTVKGLLGNILGALISKQQKTAPATTPHGPPATPAPAAPAGSPAAPSAAPAMSPIFDRSSTSGAVPGQGIGDKIPALLEPNEYVLNKNAVNGMGGPKVLDQINYGLYPRFGTGGPTNSAKKFLKLGEGWVPVPEDSKNIHLGRRMSGKHGGTDIPMPVGTPLLAPFDGTVKENGKNPGGWGNFMVIKSTSGAYSLFGHVSQYVKKQGERVSAGEQVALSGHQHGGGRSSGPHLHWEIGSSWNGTMGGKIDPITWSSGKAIPSVSGQTTSTATDAHSPSENTSPEITAEMAASATESLGKLFKMLNAPSANQELTSTPKPATPPKITQTVSQSSGNLQRVQKENLQLQSQSRNQSKTGGNVITLGQPNKTITQTTSQPMTAALGNTTPPNPLINYPIAP
jgi:murein DD-endopeptidase MepM/ murein hydrolase activator NlpD